MNVTPRSTNLCIVINLGLCYRHTSRALIFTSLVRARISFMFVTDLSFLSQVWRDYKGKAIKNPHIIGLALHASAHGDFLQL